MCRAIARVRGTLGSTAMTALHQVGVDAVPAGGGGGDDVGERPLGGLGRGREEAGGGGDEPEEHRMAGPNAVDARDPDPSKRNVKVWLATFDTLFVVFRGGGRHIVLQGIAARTWYTRAAVPVHAARAQPPSDRPPFILEAVLNLPF